jgi:hypothetical protein
LAVVLFTTADSSRLAVGDAVRLNPQLLSRDSFGDAEQRFGLVPGRLVQLSSESVDLDTVATEVGSREEAANLMASARQRSFGDGGDLTSQLPGRSGAPLVMAVVRLEEAATPSGLAWTRGRGPDRPLPDRTPTEVVAEVMEASLMLSSQALMLAGVPLNRVLREIRDMREQRYELFRGFFHGITDDEDAAAPRLHALQLPPSARVVGRRIDACGLDSIGVVVKAIRRGPGPALVLEPGLLLQAGDTLVLLGTPQQLDAAELTLI